MPSCRQPEPALTRRALLAAGLGLAPLQGWATQNADTEALLRKGGVVVVFRHALAPGTFDPPGLRLGDCSTQRNLSDAVRTQARRVGEWFRERQLQPAAVRSSPWCRCMDSATLAFGAAQAWAALGSPHGAPETTGASHLQELRKELVTATGRSGRFEAWFTHMFVQSDLANDSTRSGDALVLQAHQHANPQVLARLSVAP
ncbi:histidine phosphatase family protein [Acidovorax sp. BoFeN1]|uniref:histidine phosphatase family protein n=1 Tax=Acidovorax sp. BoFeN1 TaxID=1231053 RepID=UPI000E09DED6|nr:histidine phosphatase family protein [Acidovorax sp. BoFeN1]RDD93728.1 histidine phosphatase family protein [Acidovorax sp. BoFeN1]